MKIPHSLSVSTGIALAMTVGSALAFTPSSMVHASLANAVAAVPQPATSSTVVHQPTMVPPAANSAQAAGAVSTSTRLQSIPSEDAAFFLSEASLQRQLQILKLKTQIADLKKKLASSEGDSSQILPAAPIAIAPPPMGSGGQRGAGSAVISSLAIPESGAPQPLSVVSVMGIAGEYRAELVDHGVHMSVQEGNVLTDGWHVDRITPTAVVLRKGRQHKTVHIGE